MLHQCLFDCAWALGKLFRKEEENDEAAISLARSARDSWRGYLLRGERSTPDYNSPLGSFRSVLCTELDMAAVIAEKAKATGHKLERDALQVHVIAALAAVFNFMAALVESERRK